MAHLHATPIRRRKLYEEIVDQLQAMMLRGSLLPGEQIPSERELTATFGVGRTAVREALFALNRMGLVNLQNGERAFVTRPSATGLLEELSPSIRHMLQAPDGIRHFQGARMLFEVALARHAAQHATATNLEALEGALSRNKKALNDLDVFVETDVAFHFVIAEIARNPIVTSLLQAMASWLREQRVATIRRPGAATIAFRAHNRIYKAISQNDPDAAERAMRQHLADVSRIYWRARDEQP
jgi:DNA-binding FadR family transcriptional regulator